MLYIKSFPKGVCQDKKNELSSRQTLILAKSAQGYLTTYIHHQMSGEKDEAILMILAHKRGTQQTGL